MSRAVSVDEFDAVTSFVSSGAWRAPLTNDEKLVLYGLFKQATEGDCQRGGPVSFLDPVGAAKHEAWMQLRGMTRANARAAYVVEFFQLRETYAAYN